MKSFTCTLSQKVERISLLRKTEAKRHQDTSQTSDTTGFRFEPPWLIKKQALYGELKGNEDSESDWSSQNSEVTSYIDQ